MLEALKKGWYDMDCICGKRLAQVLQEVVVIPVFLVAYPGPLLFKRFCPETAMSNLST